MFVLITFSHNQVSIIAHENEYVKLVYYVCLAANKRLVYEEVKKAVKRDRSKVKVCELSEHGLMEITRKRVSFILPKYLLNYKSHNLLCWSFSELTWFQMAPSLAVSCFSMFQMLSCYKSIYIYANFIPIVSFDLISIWYSLINLMFTG